MKTRLYPSFLLAAAVALLLFKAAGAEETVSTIKFSDPAKPGTVKIILSHGDLRIVGSDTTEIAVKSEAKPKSEAPRKDGLRVLASSSSFSLTEKDNVVTLDALSGSWMGSSSDFRLTVPRTTTVVVANSYGGDITCGGITGDVEIKSMNGEVQLADLTGGALVDTMNGEIHASVLELHDGKPLSFTSMNGEVVVSLPAAAKANIRIRTQNGEILTDFSDKSLVTKTEATPRTSRHGSRTPKAAPAAPGVPAPAVAAIPAAPAAAPEPPDDHDGVLDRESRAEIRATMRDAIRIGAEATHEALSAAREALVEAGVTHLPPMPPLPPMTGGKLISGTLNGGGPELSIATMNGDVTLRQLEAKK